MSNQQEIEEVAKALFYEGEGSAAEEEPDYYRWENWPETGRQASLAQADYSKEDYRRFALKAIERLDAVRAASSDPPGHSGIDPLL
jgi:hypothetical protein